MCTSKFRTNKTKLNSLIRRSQDAVSASEVAEAVDAYPCTRCSDTQRKQTKVIIPIFWHFSDKLSVVIFEASASICARRSEMYRSNFGSRVARENVIQQVCCATTTVRVCRLWGRASTRKDGKRKGMPVNRRRALRSAFKRI